MSVGSELAPAVDVERRVTFMDGLVLVAVFLLVARVATGGTPLDSSGQALLVLTAILTLTLAYLARRGLLPLPAMSATNVTVRGLLAGVAVGLVLPGVQWTLIAATRLTQGWSHPYVPWWAVPSALAEVGWAAIAFRSVMAPVVEELVFRGGFYSGLRTRLRVGWAVPISAFTFAALHPGDGLLFIVFLGVATAVLYERTNSLWVAVTTHATFNTFLVLTGMLMYRWGDVPGTDLR